MRLLFYSFFCLWLLFFTGNLFAQEINENPLKIVSVQAEKSELSPGSSTGVTIYLELAKEHHAYLDQFKVTPLKPLQLSISEPVLSPVVEFLDKLAKKKKKGVEGESQLKVVVELPLDVPVGKQQLLLQLRYQACTDEYCLFPKKLKVEVPIEVVANIGLSAQGGPAKAESLGFLDVDFNSGNWGWIFFVVFIAGFLTSFTPCIFPMIPITLTVLGARGKEQSHLKGFLTSVSYVFGIAITYAILGLIAASTGSLFGGLLGHPVVIGSLALLFFGMSLSMLGLFELKAPASISNRLSQAGGGGGYGGAFVVGAAAGIVASPCVGPVLVTILAYVAKTQQLALGFGLLFTFAFGMGQVFIVLGTFSQLIQKLPKSGNWMDGVKYIFALVMMALAIFYLDPLLSPTLFNVLTVIGLLAFGLFFLLRKKLLFIRVVGLLLLFLAFTISSGAFSKGAGRFGSIINPVSIGENGLSGHWELFSAKRLERAQKEGKAVVVDFVADWCGSCQELEAFTFSNVKVRELAKEKGVVWLQYDSTIPDDEFEGYRKKYNIMGLPTVLLFDKDGIRDDLRLTGFEDAPSFIERLNKLNVQ